MLPHDLPLHEIDDGVRDLVITLNKVPDVYTMTTCQGHIWEWCPAWPSKDGWIYPVIPEQHDALVERLKGFCAANSPTFSFEHPYSDRKYDPFAVRAHWEPHYGSEGTLIKENNDAELAEYWARARLHEPKILAGWHELDAIVNAYIKDDLKLDPATLPFVGTPAQDARSRGCRF